MKNWPYKDMPEEQTEEEYQIIGILVTFLPIKIEPSILGNIAREIYEILTNKPN